MGLHRPILRTMFLTEDSQGSMRRILGVSQGWARFFQERFGKLAFPAANLFVNLAKSSSRAGTFSHDLESSDYEAQMRAVFKVRPMFFDALDRADDPIDDLVMFLKRSPPLAAALKRPNPDLMAVNTEIYGAIYHRTGDRVDHLGEEFMSFEGGYSWKTVSNAEFKQFGGPMANCGTAKGDKVFVLFDPNGKPRIAATWIESRRSISSVLGRANTAPAKRFEPMIDALIERLQATRDE